MNYVERLRDIHESDQRIDPSDYVDLVRRALRSVPSSPTRELLQETYEKALQETYASRAEGALAKVAVLGATLLHAVGEQAGAIARLDQALQIADDDPSSRAVILGERAVYEALSANPTSSVELRRQARSALPQTAPIETALSVETQSAVVSMLLLEEGAPGLATIALANARSSDFDGMVTTLMVYLINSLACSHDVDQAVAWADSLHGYAASVSHPARELDAAVAQLALRARRSLVELPTELEEAGQRTSNFPALSRLGALRIYSQLLIGNPLGARESAEKLGLIEPDLNGGFTLTYPGFTAYVEAHVGSNTVVDLRPPSNTSLPMVAGALASAEAVAIAGSQSLAADWYRWLDLQLPKTVETSLEWPSCRRRVEALLLLRLGREREAVTRLQDAIRCCEESQDNIQAAIGRLQLSEALLRGSTASMVPAARARSLRETGAEELRALGVDPIPFAYAASRTFLREEQMPERGGLTPREAQVLGRLAKGLTYREIGADLGINSRTVGVHASHCYEKLGVRNRVEAVKLAQELGVV